MKDSCMEILNGHWAHQRVADLQSTDRRVLSDWAPKLPERREWLALVARVEILACGSGGDAGLGGNPVTRAISDEGRALPWHPLI